MSFNPFDVEFTKLHNLITKKKQEITGIRERLNWYDSVDNIKLGTSLSAVIEKRKSIENLMVNTKRNLKKNEDEITIIVSQLKTRANPLNWFNSEQSKLRKKRSKLSSEIVAMKKQAKSYRNKCIPLIEEQKKIESTLREYNEFDKPMYTNMENVKLAELLKLESDFSIIKRDKEDVDCELKEVIEQINEFRCKIDEANNRIEIAEAFNKKLDRALNSYERKMVHTKCEDTLGKAKPSNIISNEKGNIEYLNRNLVKLEDRATSIGLKSSRKIKKIIIDGNNLCYKGNAFLGLDPLKSLVSELNKKFKVSIIFDASILGKLNGKTDILDSMFRDTKFHIVQSGTIADETIVNLAENDTTCYILSNDKFGDYRDKDVVKTGRIIKHEIFDGRVLINDLGIDTNYRSKG